MVVAELLAAGSFVVLAVAHSVLGERGVLQPLFAASWSIEQIPRSAAERLLRIAWHLTSVAWLGLGSLVLGVPALVSVGLVGVVSAALMAVFLRGHFAWPIFLVGGLAAFHAEAPLPTAFLQISTAVTAATLAGAAALHGYWAAGGEWGRSRALPVDPERPRLFSPGPFLTASVAVALLVAAGLVSAVGSGAGPDGIHWLIVGAAAVFGLRAIGDTRLVGFTKTVRSTDFSRADDQWFTPLCVFITLGLTAAVMV